MNLMIAWLMQQWRWLPQPWLEAWGLAAIGLGWALVVLALWGGLLTREAGRWRLARVDQRWDGRAAVAAGLAAALVMLGHVLSFLVWQSAAPQVELIKLLCALAAMVLFRFPALLVMPLALLAGDIVTARPQAQILAWLPGYLLLPGYLWLAVVALGERPDFRRRGSWLRYLLFALLFLAGEPVIWSHFLSELVTPPVAYYRVQPTAMTIHAGAVALAPLLLLPALPMARRFGLVPGRMVGHPPAQGPAGGVNLGLAGGLTLTLVFMLVLMPISCRHHQVSTEQRLEQARVAQAQLAEILARELDTLPPTQRRELGPATQILLRAVPGALAMRVWVLGEAGELVLGNTPPDDLVLAAARQRVIGPLVVGQTTEFSFEQALEGSLMLASSWRAQARPYTSATNGRRWLIVTSAVVGSSRPSADGDFILALITMASALLLLTVLMLLFVTRQLRKLSDAANKLGHGGRIEPPLPRSLVLEFDAANRSLSGGGSNESRAEGIAADDLGLWDYDLGQPACYRDAVMSRILGRPLGPLSDAAPWSDLALAQGGAELEAALARCRLGEQQGLDMELLLRMPDGFLRHLRLLGHTTGRRGDAGSGWRLSGIACDVTERWAKLAELAQQPGALEALVAARTAELEWASLLNGTSTPAGVVADAHQHGHPAPLQLLSAWMDLRLAIELGAGSQLHPAPGRPGTEGLLAQVDDVLDLCKLEDACLPLRRAEFSAAALARDLRRLAAADAKQAQTPAPDALEPPADLPQPVWGDAYRLRQLLLRLYLYAAALAPESGAALDFSSQPAGPGRCRLRFALQLAGPISTAQRRQLAAQLALAGSTPARRLDAAGLGLGLCVRLAALMDGDIALLARPGQACEYVLTLELPLAPGPDTVS